MVCLLTFSSLLHLYSILKQHCNVSPTLNSQSDLLHTTDVRGLGTMFLTTYSNIIKNANANLDEKVRNKAVVLNIQDINPRMIEPFDDSLYHIATHQINIKLTEKEKQSWEHFTNVSAHLVAEMTREKNNESHF
ncbi:unnamed protein product [Rotaria socialis]|uniref:Uncharacterized protein n=1 Tax=Rotaria socialis TaxID=392032 RepID=A0A821B0B2_9BILA|nr:unnamed protein product [Rotaria socialis]